MEHWTDAVYEATGIPLAEADVAVVAREEHWWLVVFHQPVLALGTDPAATRAVTPMLRPALVRALQARLSRVLPQVQRRVEALDPVRAGAVTAAVVIGEDPTPSLDGPQAPERGWPHVGLRLSVGALDVEVDLDPYDPDDPVDLDEVTRQAAVLLEAVRWA